MKKILALMLFVLTLSLFGCQLTEESTPKDNTIYGTWTWESFVQNPYDTEYKPGDYYYGEKLTEDYIQVVINRDGTGYTIKDGVKTEYEWVLSGGTFGATGKNNEFHMGSFIDGKFNYTIGSLNIKLKKVK